MTSVTYPQASEAIYKRLLSNWDSDEVPVVLDNEEFTPPSDGKSWIRLTVVDLPGGQETLGKKGNRQYLRNGIAFVQVFIKNNIGIKTALDLALSIQAIFEGNSFDGLNFNNTTIKRRGSDGLWYQVVVENNFNYNEQK